MNPANNAIGRRRFSQMVLAGSGVLMGGSLMTRSLVASAMSPSTLTAASPTKGMPGFQGDSVRKFTLALTPGSIGVQVSNQNEIIDLASRHGFESIEPLGEELAKASDGDWQR